MWVGKGIVVMRVPSEVPTPTSSHLFFISLFSETGSYHIAEAALKARPPCLSLPSAQRPING